MSQCSIEVVQSIGMIVGLVAGPGILMFIGYLFGAARD